MSAVVERGMGRAAQRWGIALLRNDAAIIAGLAGGINAIYGGDPDIGTRRPYGVVQIQAVPEPVRVAVGPYRFWTDVRLLVKFVGDREHYDLLSELSNRADVHFSDAQFQVIDAMTTMVVSTRAGDFDPRPAPGVGELTEQVGFFYQVKVQELGQA